ncbi:MAG: polysaccharide deacetylase family protein, partial [Ancrocorticia sp.]|nr:polysaccharide deacetylase family protein [Ancrocorticia sp.]
RPPYGATNATVRSVIASRGQAQILWSLDTLDWKNRDVKKDIEIATEKAEPGAIVLMHDIHPETVKAVPTIIDELQLAGYDLVTVSEL